MPVNTSARKRIKILAILCGVVMAGAVAGLITIAMMADTAARRTTESWHDYVAEVESKVALLTEMQGDAGFAALTQGLQTYVLTQDPAVSDALERHTRTAKRMLDRYAGFPLTEDERFALRALQASLTEYRDKLAVARHMAKRGVPPEQVAEVVTVEWSNSAMALELLGEAWTRAASHQREHLTAALAWMTRLTQSTLFAVPVLLLAGFLVLWLTRRQSDLAFVAERERAGALHSEALYRDLVEGSLQGLLIHDDFRPLFVNPAFARMFGFESVEAARAMPSFIDLVDESARPDLRLVHGKIMDGEVQSWTGRLQCRDLNGNSVWVEEMARPIRWYGKPAVQMTVLNVTEQVVHEEDMELQRGRTEDQAREMVELAEELDAALSLAEEQKAQLHRLSISDALTNTYNRRHFMDCARHEMSRLSRAADRVLSVLMIDIDFFKRINDTHGHAAGDDALKTLAAVCQKELRDSDVFARLGGEEFGALLPETGVEEAAAVAERLRQRAEAIVLHSEAGTTFGLTISVGAAQVVDPNAAFDLTLNRADAALYRSKMEGRNRVTVDPRRPPTPGSASASTSASASDTPAPPSSADAEGVRADDAS